MKELTKEQILKMLEEYTIDDNTYIEEEIFNEQQAKELAEKYNWKLDRKYWTDEYRQKCSERMKLYWQQRKNNYDKKKIKFQIE